MTAQTTAPLFEVARSKSDPLATAIRAIAPQLTRAQVADLKELIAAEAEAIARPVKRLGALR